MNHLSWKRALKVVLLLLMLRLVSIPCRTGLSRSSIALQQNMMRETWEERRINYKITRHDEINLLDSRFDTTSVLSLSARESVWERRISELIDVIRM